MGHNRYGHNRDSQNIYSRIRHFFPLLNTCILGKRKSILCAEEMIVEIVGLSAYQVTLRPHDQGVVQIGNNPVSARKGVATGLVHTGTNQTATPGLCPRPLTFFAPTHHIAAACSMFITPTHMLQTSLYLLSYTKLSTFVAIQYAINSMSKVHSVDE